MLRRTRTLTCLIICAIGTVFSPAQSSEEDSFQFELDVFEVFYKNLKIIDGFTGRDYTGEHPVIIGFRREFDDILKRYHKKLLLDEAKKLKARSDIITPFSNDLAALADSFGFEGFEVKGPHLERESSIFSRMVKDPIFRIEELVVWNLDTLNARKDYLPDTKYAKDIRFNEGTNKWERRVITKWKVGYMRFGPNKKYITTTKEQGLNLDTQKGFHFSSGLHADVPPEAFKDVRLQYPIFYNTGEDADTQVQYLIRTFVGNLFYIYDPFSWVVRGNTRFRGGFQRQLCTHISEQPLNVDDREWFDYVLASFLNDIITIRTWGIEEIYDHQMLSASQKNKNQLGEDLDLLNWNKNEDRHVDYDPNKPTEIPNISFDNKVRARYILLDAYRRYGNRFLDALRTRVLNTNENTNAKQLVKDALEEASDVPADKYITAAIRAQTAELGRFIRD